jgi:hypothetical protein
MRQVIAHLDKPYPIRQTRLRRLTNAAPPMNNPVNLVLSVFTSTQRLATVDAQVARRRAGEDVVSAGAAVLAYRARHDVCPDRLEQAMPQPPLDPFSGQPLKYRREGDGFVVYSVGASGKFDGGQPGRERYPREAYFRFPAPLT